MTIYEKSLIAFYWVPKRSRWSGEQGECLLEKPSSVRGKLSTYRPITISDVLYRIFTKIISKHIQKWTEETEDGAALGDAEWVPM